MHYNLHERVKPKRHVPYKKILLISVAILVVVAAYVLVFHSGDKTPDITETKQPA